MAEEHHHAFGHHGETGDKKESKTAMYWQLGIAAAGLVVAVLFLAGGNNKKQSSSNGQLVHQSMDYIPNPTDISIGSNAAPLYWPALPTSGTPHHPKTHHTGDKDHDNDKKEKHTGHTNKSNDKKGYGKSPTGATHGHHISAHNIHNPKTVASKGHANG